MNALELKNITVTFRSRDEGSQRYTAVADTTPVSYTHLTLPTIYSV